MHPSRRATIVVLAVLTTIGVVGLLVTPASAGNQPNDPSTSSPADPGRYVLPSGPIHWTLHDAEVLEGGPGDGHVLEFVLEASHAPSQNLAFWASTQGAFATEGVDFVGFKEMLVVFPAGETSITIEVEVIGDAFIEDDEVMLLYVWRSQGDGFLSKLAFGTIIDDDILPPLPRIEIPKAGPRRF
jgi:hypothetical protein